MALPLCSHRVRQYKGEIICGNLAWFEGLGKAQTEGKIPERAMQRMPLC
jgi:hypothetical protein